MKRTAGTVLVAIAEMLIGLFFMMMALLMVWMLAKNSSMSAPGVPSMKGMFAVAGGMYGVLGALGISTGIGILSARNWARILTIAAGSMLAFIGLLTGALTTMIPLPAVPNMSEQQIHLLRIVMVGFWAFVAMIGVWWVVLMTRPRIVTLFRNQPDGEFAESSRPLSITIIGTLFIIFSVFGLAMELVLRSPNLLLGYVVTGSAALVLNSVLAVLYGLLGVGLLRLDRRAYLGTLGLLGFGAVNALMLNVLPGRVERLHQILEASPAYTPSSAVNIDWVFSPWYGLFMVAIGLGLPAYFLITRRNAFYKAPSPETPETLVV
jgi:hypothetical protein